MNARVPSAQQTGGAGRQTMKLEQRMVTPTGRVSHWIERTTENQLEPWQTDLLLRSLFARDESDLRFSQDPSALLSNVSPMDNHGSTQILRLLTVNQAAEYMAISRWTVYRLVREGELTSVKAGSHLRFRREAIDAYLERG